MLHVQHDYRRAFLFQTPQNKNVKSPNIRVSILRNNTTFFKNMFQQNLLSSSVWITKHTRWSGDVIRRTGKKYFHAVSHNRARPSVLFPNSLQYFYRQNSTDHSCYWMNIQVDPTRSNLASAILNSKIRPRAVVGYGVKMFLPSPPNYVTRSPRRVEYIVCA